MGSCSIDPLSWGNCVSEAVNYVGSKVSNAASAAGGAIATVVQGVALAMYQAALTAVVDIFVSVGATIALAVDSAIDTFAVIASSLGIFALPFLTITTVALAGGVYIAFEVLKDTPILGALE